MNGQTRAVSPGIPQHGISRRVQRIKSLSASHQIHQALRNRIIELSLKPGQSLSRTEVCETYGVSQTPVRDAMQRLQEEGLLDIFPQSKTEVSRIDITQAQETQFLRIALEVETVRHLCGLADRSFIDGIGKMIAAQERALDAKEMAEFAELDRAFHRALCSVAGVENLCDLIASRSGHIDRLRNLNLPEPGKSTSILTYHRRILTEIAEGNAEAACAAMREHLSGTLSQVGEIRLRYPDYF